MKHGALLAMVAIFCWSAVRPAEAAVINIASHATPIMGTAVDAVGTHDVLIANAGPIGEVVDGVTNANLTANAYIIGGNGSTGANGNGADTYAAGWPTYQFDYIGALFAEPQFGVSSVRIQNYLANDGGWWGPTSIIAGGAPLTAADLLAPMVQVTSNGGATWTNLAATSNYVQQYTGVVRGTGFPNATSGPLATFEFAPQNGINGIRLIGEGAGPADGSGFIGVNEFEVLGAPQELTLEVNRATGRVRLVNQADSPVALDLYRINSPSGALDLSSNGWNSLQQPSRNPANFPAGSGSGNGWETLGTPSSTTVAEAFLLGNSTLLPGSSASLGRLFSGATEDLTLRYRTAAGTFISVAATYVTRPALAADFNDDDQVDAADLAIWRSGFGGTGDGDANGDGRVNGADFLVWQRELTAGSSAIATIHAVPEPTSVVLAGLALGLLPALGQPGTAARGPRVAG
ncbi:hypothetical protein [Lacipirellula sp.]|uniref:hypothetical protein n=1 Tax=Lacipirellula sp. TaxID=2691419 RepID=UPI003D13B45C